MFQYSNLFLLFVLLVAGINFNEKDSLSVLRFAEQAPIFWMDKKAAAATAAAVMVMDLTTP